MNKYKVSFKKIEYGYAELFGDTEDDAIRSAYKREPYSIKIESTDCEYIDAKIIDNK